MEETLKTLHSQVILYLKDHKDQKTHNLKKERYKNQKPIYKLTEKEVGEGLHSQQLQKYLGIKLAKEVKELYSENVKTLRKLKEALKDRKMPHAPRLAE